MDCLSGRNLHVIHRNQQSTVMTAAFGAETTATVEVTLYIKIYVTSRT